MCVSLPLLILHLDLPPVSEEVEEVGRWDELVESGP